MKTENSNTEKTEALNIADVSGSFKEAAAMLKETAMLMAFKYLLNAPKDKEREKNEAWLRRIGDVIKWMENYR